MCVLAAERTFFCTFAAMNNDFQLLTPLLDVNPEPGVRVLAADVTPLESDELFWFALSRLSSHRRKLVEETKNRKVQNLRLGAALLLDKLLNQHGLHECDMEYFEGEHGKPGFATIRNLAFSLSHSGSVAAAALMPAPFVTYESRAWKNGEPMRRIASSLGLDVQKQTHKWESVAKAVFSEEELAAIRQAPAPDEHFTRLWARHESHVKATGEGVGRPLPEIPAEARIHEFQFGDYLLSLCIL